MSYVHDPSRYIKDYSWIRDVGSILAKTAHQVPELVRYNRAVKENKNINDMTYNAITRWWDELETKDPEVWNSLAAGIGVNPDGLKGVLQQRIRPPKANEENEAYGNYVVRDVMVPIVQALQSESGGSMPYYRALNVLGQMPGTHGQAAAITGAAETRTRARDEQIAREEERRLTAQRAAHERTQSTASTAALEMAIGTTPQKEMSREPVAQKLATSYPSALGDRRVSMALGNLPREEQPRAVSGGGRAPAAEKDVPTRSQRESENATLARTIGMHEEKIQKLEDQVGIKKAQGSRLAATRSEKEQADTEVADLMKKIAAEKEKLEIEKEVQELYNSISVGGAYPPSQIRSEVKKTRRRGAAPPDTPTSGAVRPTSGGPAVSAQGGARQGRFIVTEIE